MTHLTWLVVVAAAGCGAPAVGGGELDASDRGAVELESAGGFAVLAQAGISTVSPSTIAGDVGLAPAPGNFLTGFSLAMEASNVYATSPQVTGRIRAANYASPTPTDLACAIGDLQHAFTDAAARTPAVTELGAGTLGGALAPGTYAWSTDVRVPTALVLTGGATDVWIFQVAHDLTVADGATIALAGGAVPDHVVWQVSGLVDVGAAAHVEGTILGKSSIALHAGASLRGRLLAQTTVALDGATVVAP